MILNRDDSRARAQLLKTLSSGEVAIFPCDTIYGFIGRVPDTDSKIRSIKGRGETNPFLMLVGSVAQAAALSSAPLDSRVTSLWPGPLTVVVRSGSGTVAMRLPDDPFLSGVVDELGAPIYSTSVNRSGQAPLWRIADIVAEFESDVELIVDAGDCPAGMPSTILDLTRAPYRILRQGAYEVPASLLAGE